MSLFVGNLSKNVTYEQLRDVFDEFGPCKVQRKNGFAFIKYDSEQDADKAITKEKDRNMGGLTINIEWSKSSNKFDQSSSNRPPPQKRKEVSQNVECYNCRGRGHYARDCTSSKRQRSRSPRRGGDRDRDRKRYDRGRSRSDSRGRRGDKDRRRDRRRDSRSDDRGRDRDDSRSDYRNRRDKRDRFDDRRRKRRDSRDRSNGSRSPPRYKRNERGGQRGVNNATDRNRSDSRNRSNSPRGDQNNASGSGGSGGRVYSNERVNANQQDYSKNDEPGVVRNGDNDYEKRSNQDGNAAPDHDIEINAETKEKNIGANGGGDEYQQSHQQDSYLQNDQQTDEIKKDANATQINDKQESHPQNPKDDSPEINGSMKKSENAEGAQ